jgi:hypothetical protein
MVGKRLRVAAPAYEPTSVNPGRPMARTYVENGKARRMQGRVQAARAESRCVLVRGSRRVETGWVTRGEGEGRCLGIAFARGEWRCSGGPAVVRPSREGPIHDAIEKSQRGKGRGFREPESRRRGANWGQYGTSARQFHLAGKAGSACEGSERTAPVKGIAIERKYRKCA